jgi:hypothetical protein
VGLLKAADYFLMAPVSEGSAGVSPRNEIVTFGVDVGDCVLV